MAGMAAALVLLPLPVGAQEQETEAELVRHLHEIAPLAADADRAAREARAARERASRPRRVVPVDTLAVGPLRILAPADERRAAEGFFRQVWEGYAPFVASSPSTGRTTYVFQWSNEPAEVSAEGTVRRVELGAWRPASAVRSGVENVIATTLGVDLPPLVARWAGSSVRAPDAEVARTAFLELATTPSKATHDCLDSDPVACWMALGLDLDDTPLDDWYTPEERRALVSAWSPGSREDQPLWTSCVESGSIPDCDQYLSRFRLYGPIQNRNARGALLWLALRAGGAGAWERLRADPGASPGDALRSASGLGTEELASRWRTWVLQGAPRTRAALDPHLLFSLMWIAALAALAMRSTRWRLR
jgi:hypothetical protein